MEPNPNEDGDKHINVYSKGKTDLGRWLSNFTHSPFIHPEYGKFESMEGFWYWVKTGMSHGILKTVWGWKAKEMGKKYPIKKCSNFRSIIKSGIKCKILQSKDYKDKFILSNLPFEHYYFYGTVQKTKIIVPPGSDMFIEILEEIRKELKAKKQGKVDD